MESKFLFSFITTLIITGLNCSEDPTVKTPLGKIKGQLRKSFEGRSFVAFEGVPFAKPPVGQLRFADPQPVEAWTGTWDANSLHSCVQSEFGSLANTVGDEDCLYLNIYVPEDKLKSDEKLDVIVHIHGGAFMVGNGHAMAHPDYLMDRNIILVTTNYRLGILGFLSTGDKSASGNLGLKDQSLALKWIQTNIESFGGNPNSVTLTGISAGAASVHFHYFSPLSKNLFHRGIAHSGVALNPWAQQEQPLEKAKKLAVSVGCPDKNTKDLVECLRQRPARLLQSKVSLFFGFAQTVPIAPFAPIVDKFASKPFLPDSPYFLLTQKKVLDVPFVASQAQEEGRLFSSMFKSSLDTLNKEWSQIAPFLLDYNYTNAKSLWAATAKEIKDFYIGEDKDITLETFPQLSKMIGDRYFSFDCESAVRLQSKATKSPVYFYNLNYKGTHSLLHLIDQSTDGAKTVPTHADDAFYIFTSKSLPTKNPPSESDLEMKNAYLDFYVNFAKTGKATFGKVNWEPVNNGEFKYLNITSLQDIKMHRNEELSSRAFWKQLGLLENQAITIAKDEL